MPIVSERRRRVLGFGLALVDGEGIVRVVREAVALVQYLVPTVDHEAGASFASPSSVRFMPDKGRAGWRCRNPPIATS